MNYYERHLGDLARDTSHLSALEFGIYSLLLDRYYATEAPIPAAMAHRWARARTDEERAAVDVVLAEFFTLDDGAWRQKRCDAEIERSTARIEAARENGRRGGRPPKARLDETQPKPNPFDPKTQVEALQTPDTNHHKEEREARAPATADLPPPQPATAACLAMRAEGIGSVNAGDPRLLALVADGAQPAEFAAAAREAVERGKGFAYALAVAKGRRSDAAAAAGAPLAQGPPPRRAARRSRGEILDDRMAELCGRTPASAIAPNHPNDHARDLATVVDVPTRRVA